MPVLTRRRRRGPHLAICAAALFLLSAPTWAAAQQPHSADLDTMIEQAAKRHGIPEHLLRRVVERESKYNPRARNHKYWGLMQISYPTARSMGFRGTPEELLNPVTNLTYAVPYLANAFIAAGRREDAAVRLYASGYYDTARRRGLLGLMRTAESSPTPVVAPQAAAEPPSAFGIFGSLFGASEPPPAAEPPVAAALPAEAPVAQPAPQPPAQTVAAMHGGKETGDGVAMVADRTGRLEPPKTWRRDGGVTVMARGEQSADVVAAVAGEHDGIGGRHGRHHAHKNTAFASLDVPASAQAYAEAPGQQAAPSQAAIEQAVSQPGAAPADAQPAPAAPAQVAVAEPAAATPAAHKRRSRHGHGRHEPADTHSAVAAKAAPKAVAELRP